MTTPADPRLAAFAAQLAAIHDGLREMLAAVLADLEAARTGSRPAELLEHCYAFCGAVSGHHRNEDDAGFSAVVDLAPATAPAIQELRREHEVVAGLLRDLEGLLSSGRPADEIGRSVDGLAALLESHFRYEERTLDTAIAGTP